MLIDFEVSEASQTSRSLRFRARAAADAAAAAKNGMKNNRKSNKALELLSLFRAAQVNFSLKFSIFY